MAVFNPNLTSKLLVKAVKAFDSRVNHEILEVGCGSGWITEQIAAEFYGRKSSFFLSDVSKEAVESAQNNLKTTVPNAVFKVGSGLKPWADSQFDVIINDVAGISDAIAEISPWYVGVPCSAGTDGLANTRQILKDVNDQLRTNGTYFAPVISLANASKHRKLLEGVFSSVTYVNRIWWPIPEEILHHAKTLDDMEKYFGIETQEKYGKRLAYTEVAICER
jgi:SAM-dependent methyltransferase